MQDNRDRVSHKMKISMHMPKGSLNTIRVCLKAVANGREIKPALHLSLTLESPELQVPESHSTLWTRDNEAQVRRGYIDPAINNSNAWRINNKEGCNKCAVKDPANENEECELQVQGS